ncbi:hypothetical protein [Desulfoluna spongiiphila]|uniref:Uncharacterized protein n=1 Tax=Desulfoluna spongiiphila TaxID=419481 RepID=A0A1G5AF36_9BACT|nr:hypothetical protein [Desulfoluna spongiiphila]SCX76469.1 hypothetical protein SAMN05216233_101123 [Desulfoluna spongiiphila]VVS90650.1 hypothetical protein DBB_2170 [Desulfoluna spongiiphila]
MGEDEMHAYIDIDGQRRPVLDCTSWGVRYRCAECNAGDWHYATIFIGSFVTVAVVIEVIDVDWGICSCRYKAIGADDKAIIDAVESSIGAIGHGAGRKSYKLG